MASTREGATSRSWLVPEGWRQGRGAWGGLVIGAMLRGVQGSGSTDPMRSVTAQICAPVSGAVNLDVRALRSGSSMSTWQVGIFGAEQLASGVVITGADRRVVDAASLGGVALADTVSPPDFDANWSAASIVPVHPPVGPEFATHFEFRVLDGMPLSGAPPRTRGWIRDATEPSWDEVRMLSIVDAWWPCLYVSLREPRPMATVDFTAHLVGDPTLARAGEPLLFDAELIAERGGYATERRRLWSASGALLVESLQILAIIR